MPNKTSTLRIRLGSTILLSACTLLGCGGGGTGGGAGGGAGDSEAVKVSDTAADGSKLSAADREAADFVRAKIESFWLKGPDGWTTQLVIRNLRGDILPNQPETLYKQFRSIQFTISPEAITESQKLNGADYRGVATFERTPERFYRTVASFEGPKGWSNWTDGSPAWGSLAVERRNGKWLIQDSEFFDGQKPDASAVPTGK